jgi:predicted transposase YbfD/YdcC
MVSGVDKSINGMHYDLIIMDDVHSDTNVTNADQIQKVVDHWKLAYSLIDPGKPIIVIGTRWHFTDLYQEILDNHRNEFNILIRRAIKEDGTALFPSRLSLEELEKIRQKQGNAHFSNQYLNEPISEEDATFKRGNMVRRGWEMVKDRPINWYLMVDPSFEGPYSDRAALVIAGMDYQRDVICQARPALRR